MRKPGTTTPVYWYLTILIVASIGVVTAFVVSSNTASSTRSSLLERTDTIAEMVPAGSVSALSGTEKDLENPVYTHLKDDFINVREANHDIEFIYIMAQNDAGEVFFHVDSEEDDSEDYSPPGQVYDEDEGEVARVTQTGTSEVLPITSDRWGTWLSAYSPIKDDSGKVVAVLGLDIPADDFYQHIAINTSVPILIATIVIILLFWTKRRSDFQQRYLAEKAFFLSFASHEIRSPLTSISWALRPLENNAPEGSTEKHTLGKINSSMDHILRTVDEVLSMQATEWLRSKRLQKQPTVVHQLLSGTIESLGLLSEERNVKIVDKTTASDKTLRAQLDPQLFKRVLSNLLVNAIKYSPSDETVQVRLAKSGTNFVISIHNEGPGISKEDQTKILGGLYRTKSAEASKQKGTGLGLMLTKDIIHRHNGQLTIDSKPDYGATFNIILPL